MIKKISVVSLVEYFFFPSLLTRLSRLAINVISNSRINSERTQDKNDSIGQQSMRLKHQIESFYDLEFFD